MNLCLNIKVNFSKSRQLQYKILNLKKFVFILNYKKIFLDKRLTNNFFYLYA